MDSGRAGALVEWVNSIDGAPCIESLSQLNDGTLFIKLLEIIVPDTIPAGLELNSVEERLEFLNKIISDVNNTKVEEKVNFRAIIDQADEFEIGKVVMLLLYIAMVFGNNQASFIQSAMKLNTTTQAALKDMLEVFMESSDHKIPPNFADILKCSVTLPAPSRRVSSRLDDVFVSAPVSSVSRGKGRELRRSSSCCSLLSSRASINSSMVVSPSPLARAISMTSLKGAYSPYLSHVYSSSPQSPLKALVDSPQLAHKRLLRQKEQEIKRLESLLNSEIHLKSELQRDLQEKNKEIVLFEAKCKEVARLQHQLVLAQDDLDHMNALREEAKKTENEFARLKMQLSAQNDLKERNKKLEAETTELYAERASLNEELKRCQSLLTTTQNQKEALLKTEAQMGGTLEAQKQELLSYQRLYNDTKVQLTEVQGLYQEATLELKVARENMQNAQTFSEGECMTIFTEKRVMELQEELASWKSQVAGLRTEVEAKEQQLKEAEIEAGRKQSDIELLRQEEGQRQQEIASLYQSLNTLKASQAKGEAEIRKLQHGLELKTQQAEDTELRASQHVREMGERCAEEILEAKQSHEQKVGQLQKEIESLKSECSKANGQIRQLEGKLQINEKQMTYTEEQASHRVTEIEEKYVSQLKEEQESYQRRMSQLYQDIEALKTKLTKAENDNSQLKETLGAKTEEMETAEKLSSERLAKLEKDYSGKCQQLDAEQQAASEILAELREKYSAKCQEMEEAETQASEKLSAMEKQCSKKCQELETELKQAMEKRGEIEKQHKSELAAERLAHQKTVAQLESHLESQKTSCFSLDETVAQLKEELVRSRQLVVENSEKYEAQLSQEREEHSAQVSVLRQLIEEANSNHDQAKAQVTLLQSELEKKVQEMEAAELCYKEKVDTLKKERDEQIQNQNDIHMKEMETVKKEMETLKEQSEAAVFKVQGLLDSKTQELENVQKQGLVKQHLMDSEMENVKQQLESEIAQLKEQLEIGSRNMSDLKQQDDLKLQKLEAELDALKQESERETARLGNLLTSKTQEMEKLRQELESQVQRLKQELCDLEEKHADRMKLENENYQQASRQLEEVETMKTSAEAKISQLQSDLDNKTQLLRETKTELGAKMAEMEGSYLTQISSLQTSHEESRAQLSAELTAARETISSSKLQITQLQNALDSKTQLIKEMENKSSERVAYTEEKYIAQLSRLETDFEKLKDRYDQSLEQIKTQQASLEARGQLVKETELRANQRLCDMEQEYEDLLKKERERQQQRVQELEHEIEMLKADYAKAQDEFLNEADSKVMKYEEEIQTAKKQVQFMESEISLAQAKCKNMEKENMNLMEKMRKTAADHQRQLSQASAMNKSLRSQLEDLERERSGAAERLSSEQQGHRAEVEKLKKQLTSTQREREEEGVINKRLAKQINSLEAQIEHANRQIRELKEKEEKRVFATPRYTPHFPAAAKSLSKKETTFDGSMEYLDDSLEEKKPMSVNERRSTSSDEDIRNSAHDASFSSVGDGFAHPMTLRSHHPAKRLSVSSTTSSSFEPTRSAGVPRGAGNLFACEEEPDMDFNWDSLSELQRRNTLCLPHLRSAYPLITQPQDISEDMMRSGRASNINSENLQGSLGGMSTRSGKKRQSGEHDAGEDRKKSKTAKPSTPGTPNTGKRTPRSGRKSRTPKISRNCQENKSQKLKRQTGAIAFNIGFSPKVSDRKKGKIGSSRTTPTSQINQVKQLITMFEKINPSCDDNQAINPALLAVSGRNLTSSRILTSRTGSSSMLYDDHPTDYVDSAKKKGRSRSLPYKRRKKKWGPVIPIELDQEMEDQHDDGAMVQEKIRQKSGRSEKTRGNVQVKSKQSGPTVTVGESNAEIGPQEMTLNEFGNIASCSRKPSTEDKNTMTEGVQPQPEKKRKVGVVRPSPPAQDAIGNITDTRSRPGPVTDMITRTSDTRHQQADIVSNSTYSLANLFRSNYRENRPISRFGRARSSRRAEQSEGQN
ncbi:early endosome antigen 1 isoform X2 [Lingula anatina]|uniref:Early endosome antigen 1 isoform X2 n=1 Tax=Lingula anatina TaxID=7574 RepID=A0A1S3HXW6_LINAN|nr:early endosome antigen 1 isoform X2 [Lingula anatina]|eukprot:XP_013390853.1 early endosome antigen 1 isoform X2 [Lingula anatina]